MGKLSITSIALNTIPAETIYAIDTLGESSQREFSERVSRIMDIIDCGSVDSMDSLGGIADRYR